MRNIKVVVEYDGTDYFGFQKQPGMQTIQGKLESALTRIIKETVAVCGAGRTDAGVHAHGQVINFKAGGTIQTKKIVVALNSMLPKDIVAKDAVEAPDEFHSRYSAKSRVYKYVILNDEIPSAISARFVWCFPYKLDETVMNRAAEALLGVHDFTSFSAAGADIPHRVREIKKLAVHRNGKHIIFDIEANAFLHSMARIIVGTLTDVGQGRLEPKDIARILEAKDRRLAGKTAPPSGLSLMEVTY
ncbi:MAG: tRNA pseudouridine(38-40) synthase TruA [Armatimonadota bacterium]